ncbi:hypothetical protein [Priestia koreensis]|uniref:hypothetical protein n=1 Tax=Priestia koreensis TaxID=284581 RepID=UPI00203E5055|nr:hypothetical protein [Priestia koreensis]MCM3004606.1 hypothetical protein [Priestia koreensis]
MKKPLLILFVAVMGMGLFEIYSFYYDDHEGVPSTAQSILHDEMKKEAVQKVEAFFKKKENVKIKVTDVTVSDEGDSDIFVDGHVSGDSKIAVNAVVNAAKGYEIDAWGIGQQRK